MSKVLQNAEEINHSLVTAWDYLQPRMLFTVCPSLYNVCCLRTYLFNLSCHSAEYASP